MNKKVMILCFLVIPTFSFIMSYFLFYSFDTKVVKIRKKIDINNDILSMYIETEEGSGEYNITNEDTFPDEGYYLNKTKSKCENGGMVSYNSSTRKVSISATSSDKCYAYFDKGTIIGEFADYIKSLYKSQGANGLYYHDESLTNGAGDNSYRYAGSSDSVNNFVCFGSDEETCPNDNLYRIIGVFDDKVKLIKYDYATKEQLGVDGDYYGVGSPSVEYYKGNLSEISRYYWNATTTNGGTNNNNWNESRLNIINLNEIYLTNLENKWSDKIVTTTWNVGGGTATNIINTNAKTTFNYEVGTNKINKTYEAKIGIMYISEYAYAAYPSAWTTKPYAYNTETTKNNNWMYMGNTEWSLSPDTSGTLKVYVVFGTGSASSAQVNYYSSSINAVRPTFILDKDVILKSGSGNISNPYRIKI